MSSSSSTPEEPKSGSPVKFIADESTVYNPKEVCTGESARWANCLEKIVGRKNPPPSKEDCASEREQFENCVINWRASIGDLPAGIDLKSGQDIPQPIDFKVKVKGGNLHPPPQCAPLSCLNQTCLQTQGFDYSKCAVMMQNIKRCTLLLFGNEWVTE